MHLNGGRVVSNFIVQTLGNRLITVYSEGLQTRSFYYVDNLIEAIVAFMTKPAEFVGPLNLGNPHEFRIIELAEMIVAPTGSGSEIVYKPISADAPIQCRPDATLARERLGWEPKVQFKEGLARTIEYFDVLLRNGS